MRKNNARNERIKRDYLAYLEEARGLSLKTTDQVAAAIAAFEVSTGWKDFAAFHIEQAKRFKRQLCEQINPKTLRPLAKATIHARLKDVKAFILWLAGQPGFRSRISYSDAEYFNLSANDTRIATAKRERPVPTVEQLRHVVGQMPSGTDIEKRDRAIIAFALLTGIRDDALASLSVGHIDLSRRCVSQDARTVRTKNRKTMITWFFPVGDDFEAVVTEWITYLVKERLFGPNDPLFPATQIAPAADGLFGPQGLARQHWKSADAIRRIFRERFEAVGLPYSNPHSIRKTLAQLGERMCRNPEEFKAWSQNLGHENVLTTFTSYGEVAHHRQAELIIGLRSASFVGSNARLRSFEIQALRGILTRLREADSQDATTESHGSLGSEALTSDE